MYNQFSKYYKFSETVMITMMVIYSILTLSHRDRTSQAALENSRTNTKHKLKPRAISTSRHCITRIKCKYSANNTYFNFYPKPHPTW